jgi:hypothetical protein
MVWPYYEEAITSPTQRVAGGVYEEVAIGRTASRACIRVVAEGGSPLSLPRDIYLGLEILISPDRSAPTSGYGEISLSENYRRLPELSVSPHRYVRKRT